MTDIPVSLRLLVYERDNWQCQSCGMAIAGGWWSVQHRQARGVGGKNTAGNLVLLCGSATTGCHRRCEDREQEMIDRGFVVWSWQDPHTIPVVRFDGVQVFFLPDGDVRYGWQADDEPGTVHQNGTMG